MGGGLHCSTIVVEKTVTTDVTRARPIRLAICPTCDRAKCPRCKAPIMHHAATHCSCGADVRLTAK